jgi:4-hydroxythreonine-4-phosphate dehydrogenase
VSLRPRIAVTGGDPAGVGPEVIRACLASPRLDQDFDFEWLGADTVSDPGLPTREGALSAFVSLEEAVAGALRGKYAAVVTGPIHKARMREVGFVFPGQTEFFADRCGCPNHAMLLTGGKITVALGTSHVPLRAVADLLCVDEIVRVGGLLRNFLELRLGRRPRIAVAGLNPHAGESGLLGAEEGMVICPAVCELEKQGGAEFLGPCSPDTVFHRALMGEVDGVLCMYHDQGLIPLKLHAFDEGVNVTLGLPFPRTSPDHGTAFEIAGRGVARPESMLCAMNLAADLARKQIAKRVL